MLKEKLAKLIDLKSIITIAMVSSLIYGFVVDKINANEFIPLVTMILTFYFSRKKENDKNE